MRFVAFAIFAVASPLLTGCSGTVTATETLDTGPEDALNRALQAINDGQCSSFLDYIVPAKREGIFAMDGCVKAHNAIMQAPQNGMASLSVLKRTVKPSETDLVVVIKTKGGATGKIKAVMQKQNGAWLIIEMASV